MQFLFEGSGFHASVNAPFHTIFLLLDLRDVSESGYPEYDHLTGTENWLHERHTYLRFRPSVCETVAIQNKAGLKEAEHFVLHSEWI